MGGVVACRAAPRLRGCEALPRGGERSAPLELGARVGARHTQEKLPRGRCGGETGQGDNESDLQQALPRGGGGAKLRLGATLRSFQRAFVERRARCLVSASLLACAGEGAGDLVAYPLLRGAELAGREVLHRAARGKGSALRHIVPYFGIGRLANDAQARELLGWQMP